MRGETYFCQTCGDPVRHRFCEACSRFGGGISGREAVLLIRTHEARIAALEAALTKAGLPLPAVEPPARESDA